MPTAKSILLVDDDLDDRELFFEAVMEVDASIACDFASDGVEALKKLHDKKYNRPDVILMDINMPEMDGWQCLSALKSNKLYKNIPVIMYSTSSHKKYSQMAADLGAVCFFTKPYDYVRLKEIINMVVSHLKKGQLELLRNAMG